jgi:hypothetical protein
MSLSSTVMYRWLAWAGLAAVVAVTLLPIGFRPVTGAPADMERACAFALLGGAFCLAYPKSRLGIVLLVIGIAGLLEAGQHLVPGRHGHMRDFAVKAFAVLGGALGSIALVRAVRSSV